MQGVHTAVFKLLKQEALPALLVSNTVNIRYLTACHVSAGRVVVTPQKVMLYVDARYEERARNEANSFVLLRSLGELERDLKQYSRIALEADDITLSQFARWKKRMKNKKLVQTSGLLEGLRRKKSDLELKSILRACSVTKAILRKIPKLLKIEMTEQELAWKIHALAHEAGCDELAFPTIVGFGTHTSIPHHEPTSKKLKRGEIVQIDMGVKVHGYCSDYSRVFFTGAATEVQRNAYRALSEAKKAAEKILRPGVSNHALDQAARDVLKRHRAEQYFTHALGHGVGLEIHEGITLSSKAPKTKLLKNEVVTIEPGVYFPGKWGMRLEDTYIVS